MNIIQNNQVIPFPQQLEMISRGEKVDGPVATEQEIREFREKFGLDLVQIRKTMKRIRATQDSF